MSWPAPWADDGCANLIVPTEPAPVDDPPLRVTCTSRTGFREPSGRLICDQIPERTGVGDGVVFRIDLKCPNCHAPVAVSDAGCLSKPITCPACAAAFYSAIP